MLSPQQVLNGSDVRAACDMCGLPEKAHQNVRKRWHHCGATALNSDVIIGAEVAAAQAKMQKAAEAEAKKDDATTTATKDAHAVELERNLANQSYDQLRAVQLATLVKFLFMHRGERGFSNISGHANLKTYVSANEAELAAALRATGYRAPPARRATRANAQAPHSEPARRAPRKGKGKAAARKSAPAAIDVSQYDCGELDALLVVLQAERARRHDDDADDDDDDDDGGGAG